MRETVLIRRGEVERILREAGISRRRMVELIACGALVPRRPEILRAKRAYFVRREVLSLVEELSGGGAVSADGA